jgi:phage terminase large subunit
VSVTVGIDISRKVFLPCYHHLLEPEQFDIEFLYGGRDSGKSRQIAQQLVKDCLEQPYFKCILTRKVKDTIKESQWDLIKSVVEEWGLSQFFNFNSSPLEIKCANGNRFIARGLDEPAKLKSVNNPSHCWVEEGNQINSEDFTIILTSLRYNGGNVKTYFSFNPECEITYTEFWLWQEYFSHTEDLSFTHFKKVEVDDIVIEYKIRATHTTYRDNPYCSLQRKALYESYKNSKNNKYWYQTYTLGLWGFRRTAGNFWKCFEEDRDVSDIGIDSEKPLHIVVDNNRNPYISIQVWQYIPDKKLVQQVYELPCAYPVNTAAKAASTLTTWLQRLEYNNSLFVYGDPSANAKTTVDDDGKSFFDKFIGKLKADQWRITDRIKKSAPSVSLSGDFINEIYESNYAGWTIKINNSCRKSIEDYNMTKENSDGGILKTKVRNKDTGQTYEKYGHMSDCKRYFLTTVLYNEFIAFASRRKSASRTALPAKNTVNFQQEALKGFL